MARILQACDHMRRWLSMSCLWILAACSPVVEPPRQTATGMTPPAPLETAPATAQTKPSLPPASPVFTSAPRKGITCEGVSYDSRLHRLVVLDQPGGPGSLHANAAAAAMATGGIAAVNGGFFTPEGAPLGLVIAGGISAGSWNSGSSLGGGLWFEESPGSPVIRRREALGKQAARGKSELLQAGPMLVENSHAVSGLENTKTSARIIVLWDGRTRWWIGRTSPCTLAGLANMIEETPPSGWKVRHALNLDGGRSADLWVSPAVSGGPVERRPPWNRPVRNFLVLKAL